MNFLRTSCALVGLVAALAVQAQNANIADPSAMAPVSPGPTCCNVANGTPVDLELVDPLSSKVQKRGDTFHIKLSTALMVDGKLLLPAGVEGMGEIIDAKPAGGGGAPGKMLVAARYLNWNGTTIPLRGTKLGGAGRNNTQSAMAAGFVAGPFAMFVHGGNLGYPVGTHLQAKLAVDAVLPPLPNTATANPSTPDAPLTVAGSTASDSIPPVDATNPSPPPTTDHHQE